MTRSTTAATRKIILIDEKKCNGCGTCVPSCVEGALQIINGKARLVKDQYCDGLGACLGECPQGALTIEERPAPAFDEKAALKHKHEAEKSYTVTHPAPTPVACGCPGSAARELKPKRVPAESCCAINQESALSHWPVQLALLNPSAPYLKGADLLITADCVPFAYPGYHTDFLQGRAVAVACPKLDDYESHLAKLTAIFKQAHPQSITVLRMEVPCCGGLVRMAHEALEASGLENVPLRQVTFSVSGEIINQPI
jgi:NAD-dependent dihydropyrimidine dehydrogenase PreA subunit